MYRRKFLSRLSILPAIPYLGRSDIWEDDVLSAKYKRDLQSAWNSSQTEYWEKIRSAYAKSDILDFNSAGLGMTNSEVNSNHVRSASDFNLAPSKKVNRYRRDKKASKSALARLTRTTVEEIAITRNATEALEIAIFGIQLKAGDEVVVGRYDYPHVYFAWQQRAKRDGIILHYVDPGVTPNSPEEILNTYLDAITPRTKAICITDLCNWNGCQHPTKAILEKLPDHVRYRIVDAAQSLGNTRDNWSEIGATHIGASLHKWIGAPVGTGLLYVDRDYISETWPLFASFSPDEETIEKFEHIGTWDTSLYISISKAVDFHLTIGHDRKLARLIELGDQIRDNVSRLEDWRLASPVHDELKSNLVVCIHADMKPKDVHAHLWKNHNIHCTTSDWQGIVGVRFSPNVFTSSEDVEKLSNVLRMM